MSDTTTQHDATTDDTQDGQDATSGAQELETAQDGHQDQDQDETAGHEEQDGTEEEQDRPESIGTATYSPEDNKLRMDPHHRLDAETFARVKAAGFAWAPRQKIFVAGMWTPRREDLLIELCGEIEDEDKSLVDRAEERADRFEGYSANRERDSEQAHRAVRSIADGIPMGQPILVGHHSERRARKDAKRIDDGMRRAIKMWDTAKYWEQRAAGALAHAKYKELPAVRARRIKGLEADLRKQEKAIRESEQGAQVWANQITDESVIRLADIDSIRIMHEGEWTSLYSMLRKEQITPDEARARAIKAHETGIRWHQRWAQHYRNRLIYERAMLGEQGGLAADNFDIQPGGKVLVRGDWSVVLKVNKSAGKVCSVSCARGRYAPVISIEQVQDYQAATTELVAAVKAVTKLPPMVNLPGEGVVEMTSTEWKKWQRASDGAFAQKVAGTSEYGPHRRRSMYSKNWSRDFVYLTDEKRVELPPPRTAEEKEEAQENHKPLAPIRMPREPVVHVPEVDKVADLREALKTGVQVISAPQLFPTPAELADRMVEELDIQPGDVVLEPSAGTGRLIEAIRRGAKGYTLTAVEIDGRMADHLERVLSVDDIHRGDFLAWETRHVFDRIIMNPPFGNAADIKHIRRAWDLLAPGGRLVAICAAGPRQVEALMPFLKEFRGTWEALPAGSFQEAGTNVNTALLVVDKPAAPSPLEVEQMEQHETPPDTPANEPGSFLGAL